MLISLSYLQNGSYWMISGLLLVLVNNWITLRNIEKEQYNLTVVQVFIACMALLFGLHIGYAAVVLLIDLVLNAYYPSGAATLIISGLFFSISIILQLILAFFKKRGKKN